MKPLLLLTVPVVAMLCSCSQSGVSSLSEEAKAEAERCAVAVVNTNQRDSIALEQAVLNANVSRSKYVSAGDQDAVTMFDYTFAQKVKSENPSLHKQIFEE